MKSWVKNLKVGDTLFFVSRVRRTFEGVTLPVSKVGRKYVYVKQSEYREIQIERENGSLGDTCGEIYESQAEYDEDQRRSRVIDEIEASMRYGGKFTKLPTPAIDAIFGIINGMVDVAALKADAARYQAMKNHKNQDNGDGSLTGDEVSVYRWENGSGTGYSPDEYDALFDRMIEEQRHDQG